MSIQSTKDCIGLSTQSTIVFADIDLTDHRIEVVVGLELFLASLFSFLFVAFFLFLGFKCFQGWLRLLDVFRVKLRMV